MSRGLDGDSLVIAGDSRANRITVTGTGGGYAVEDLGPSGVYTGDPGNSGCLQPSTTTASCEGGALNVILITGGDADDTIGIGAGVPARTSVRLNGGDGSDELTGGAGDDVLEAGYPYRGNNDGGPTSGNEKMYGGDGVDSIFADLGADLLSGGNGTDLLVSSKEVCQGHTMTGGAGKDNASWALVEPERSAFSGTMRMQIGGTGGPSTGCANLDKVGSDMESLEGSKFGDTLIGTSGTDGFLGQKGADTFLGKGGKNYIDARDGERDTTINCGGGGKNTVLTDKSDPKPKNCPADPKGPGAQPAVVVPTLASVPPVAQFTRPKSVASLVESASALPLKMLAGSSSSLSTAFWKEPITPSRSSCWSSGVSMAFIALIWLS